MKKFWRRLADAIPVYAVLPLIFCFTVNCIVYWGTGLIAGPLKHYDFTLAFDEMVPLVPGFITVLSVLGDKLCVDRSAGEGALSPFCIGGSDVAPDLRTVLSGIAHDQCEAGASWRRSVDAAVGIHLCHR